MLVKEATDVYIYTRMQSVLCDGMVVRAGCFPFLTSPKVLVVAQSFHQLDG